VTVEDLRKTIEATWDDLNLLQANAAAIEEAVDQLDLGTIRVGAQQGDGSWIVNEWVKKSMALYMKLRGHANIGVRGQAAHDHEGFGDYPLKDPARLRRVFMPVPSIIRHGAYVADHARVLASYLSMGTRVGGRTMIVNGSTVGLCSQIGADVFVAAGANVGSVCMMPLNARPIIVEDGAYIGQNAIVSEGTDPYFDHPATTEDETVVVRAGAILGAGVVISGGVPFYDVTGDAPKKLQGEVPPNAVVVRGTVPRTYPAGEYSTAASLLIGWRDPGDNLQVTLHDALRKYSVEP
jgi:2,3,4,5-tetrahydropyridine-2-carboxylate N-succinyltransferase